MVSVLVGPGDDTRYGCSCSQSMSFVEMYSPIYGGVEAFLQQCERSTWVGTTAFSMPLMSTKPIFGRTPCVLTMFMRSRVLHTPHNAQFLSDGSEHGGVKQWRILSLYHRRNVHARPDDLPHRRGSGTHRPMDRDVESAAPEAYCLLESSADYSGRWIRHESSGPPHILASAVKSSLETQQGFILAEESCKPQSLTAH